MSKRTFTDTTDFLSIKYGDEILIGGHRYLITGHERERRFGIEDPKFWVKRAIDADTSEKKIIKLVYFESFEISPAGIPIKCFRDPNKEAEILRLVQNHPSFMHGKTYHDEKGNNVRVLDIVRGKDFYSYISSLSMPHEVYYEKMLPGILQRLLKAFEAIRFLHVNGFKHGDIRNDHLIIQEDTGNYVWIDFDYDYESTENPLALDVFGIGSILLHAIGKGIHDLHMIKNYKKRYKSLYEIIDPGDFSIIHSSRFLNIRKMYPYVPKTLNDIVMHFSKSAHIFYETVDEVIEDMNRCLFSVF